jgi:hypothetical protein
MSDYLQHLVARTLSPEAGVRPQLRSAFEPPPLQGGFTLPADLELDTLVESASSASLPLNEPTPFERVPSRPLNAVPVISTMGDEPPRQVVPPLESDEDKDIVPVQPLQPPDGEPTMLQPLIGAPPDSPENSRAVSTPPSTPRPDPVPVPRRGRAAPTSDTVHPWVAVVPHQAVESEEARSKQIAVVAIRSVAPAATVLSPSPSVAPTSVRPRPAAEATRNEMVESEERRSERSAVAAIRPAGPAAPVFSPGVAPAMASPPPTIHVTIGRVEVRATPPPAGSRAKGALPPVMSLEEYLRRRAAGGQR